MCIYHKFYKYHVFLKICNIAGVRLTNIGAPKDNLAARGRQEHELINKKLLTEITLKCPLT